MLFLQLIFPLKLSVGSQTEGMNQWDLAAEESAGKTKKGKNRSFDHHKTLNIFEFFTVYSTVGGV